MIWHFTPYATDGNFFAAIDAYMRIVPEKDWVCLRDGDTMFLLSDFGHKLEEYVKRYPDTGMFTCLTNRCSYECQRMGTEEFDMVDVVWQKQVAEHLFATKGYKVKELNRRIAGHLMMIQKSTWTRIRAEVENMVKAQNKRILGVDTKISNAIIRNGLKIRLMEGFYLFHFFRLDKGTDDDSHLK